MPTPPSIPNDSAHEHAHIDNIPAVNATGSAINIRSKAPVFVALVLQMSISEIMQTTLCTANDDAPIANETVIPC